jgi:hypothetical protein
VIAVDGKTLRGSKTSSDGKGALHLVSAYAKRFEIQPWGTEPRGLTTPTAPGPSPRQFTDTALS